MQTLKQKNRLMKQAKFLMVALTILMGAMVTSCMNGEEDPNVRVDGALMRVVSTYPATFTFSDSDVKYIATNADLLITSDINIGDIVLISWSYNKDEQLVDQNTKKVNVLVAGIQNTTATSYVLDGDGANYENATVNTIGVRDYNSNIIPFLYFDKNTVVIPISCLLKEQKLENLKKHSFTLIYDKTAEKKEGEIKFYLRHTSNEEKATYGASFYKSFDIRSALVEYGEVKPTKVTIMVNESKSNDSNSLENAKDKLTEYSVDYKFKD